MAYLKEFSGKILLVIDNEYIKEFVGKYNIG